MTGTQDVFQAAEALTQGGLWEVENSQVDREAVQPFEQGGIGRFTVSRDQDMGRMDREKQAIVGLILILRSLVGEPGKTQRHSVAGEAGFLSGNQELIGKVLTGRAIIASSQSEWASEAGRKA